MMKRTKVTMLLLLAIVLAAPACNGNAPDLAVIKTTVATLEADANTARLTAAQLQGQAEAIQAVIATMPEGAEKENARALLANVQTSLQRVQAFLDKATPAIAAANAEIQKSTDWIDAAEVAVKAGVGFIPTPWGMIAGLGVPLLFSLFRLIRTKQAAINLAKSVQPLVDEARKADPKVALQLSAAQSSGAAKLVDQSQGKGGLPI